MYCPPYPKPLSPLMGLVRAVGRGDGDLLSLLPADAYKVPIGPLGYSRRSIVIVNAPDMVRTIMTDPTDIYPKNDLMVGALAPLVGDSIFVSDGDRWRRQRAMIDPAFSGIRIDRAFASMVAAVDDQERHLDTLAHSGEPLSLDLTMSHLTADIICRTVFSTSLKSKMARDVFEAFTLFERSVAHVEIKRLILDKPWKDVPQRQDVQDACTRIRACMAELLDTHLERGADYNDITTMIMAARDADTGKGFTREELIDQLGVFFLAGHETTASVLTWVFFILATQPQVAARMRTEIADVAGDGPVEISHVKRLVYTRNVFRETLRLYPPITFIPRVAREDTVIGGRRIKKGAMIMISPWTLHRHESYWHDPHVFDPDRFAPEREKDITPGAYIPFGQGPRICVGAAFATIESALILARLVRAYDFNVIDPDAAYPVARLTTRPKHQIMCTLTRRKN